MTRRARWKKRGEVICNVRNIYGSKINNAVAFCSYRKHKGYLTAKNLKAHECLRKQCPCLHKIKCAYWVEREMMKQKRKERKEKEKWQRG